MASSTIRTLFVTAMLVSAGTAALRAADQPAAASGAAIVEFPSDLPVAPEGDPIELKYKFQAGDSLRYQVLDETKLTVEAGQGTVEMNYSTETWKRFDVRTVSDGGRAVLQLTLDRVKMQAQGPDGGTAFDSQQPGVPPAEFAAIVSRVGRPILEMTVDSVGHVVGLQEPGQKATRESSLPTEMLERDSGSPVLLPTKPVSIGSSWTEQLEVPVQLEESKLRQRVTLRRKYTLVSVEQQIATIELDTIVLTPITDPAIAAQLIQRTPSGVILFDLAQGRVASKRTFLKNHVVGHEGAGSRLQVVRSYVETLADAAAPAVGISVESVSIAR